MLLGFTGKRVHTRGYAKILTMFDTSETIQTLIDRYILVEIDTSYNATSEAIQTLTDRYILVEIDTSYNALIGRKLSTSSVVSTLHMDTKFSIKDGRIIMV